MFRLCFILFGLSLSLLGSGSIVAQDPAPPEDPNVHGSVVATIDFSKDVLVPNPDADPDKVKKKPKVPISEIEPFWTGKVTVAVKKKVEERRTCIQVELDASTVKCGKDGKGKVTLENFSLKSVHFAYNAGTPAKAIVIVYKFPQFENVKGTVDKLKATSEMIYLPLGADSNGQVFDPAKDGLPIFANFTLFCDHDNDATTPPKQLSLDPQFPFAEVSKMDDIK